MFILINDENTIIDKEYEAFLMERCKNFTPSMVPFNKGNDNVNYFYRDFIDTTEDVSKKTIIKVEEFVNKVFGSEKFSLNIMWINRIDGDSNKDDTFHNDHSAVSLIIYLNDDFEGGEFEYIDENRNKVQIKPKKNLTILLDKKVIHRVKPVSKGVRFSLVFFFNIKNKAHKTII